MTLLREGIASLELFLGNQRSSTERRQKIKEPTEETANEGSSENFVDMEEEGEVFPTPKRLEKQHKRKRVETLEKEKPDKEIVSLKTLAAKLVQSSGKMGSLVSKNVNTKVELKQEIAKFIETPVAKCKEFQVYPTSIINKSAEEAASKVAEIRTGKKDTNTDRPSMRSVGVQVDIQQHDIEQARTRREILDLLDGEWRWEDVKAALEKEWLEKAFATAKLRQGSPIAAGDQDIALFVGEKLEGRPLNNMRNKYPEIGELVDQELTAGQPEFIECVTMVKTSRKKLEEKRKFIYLLLQKLELTEK